jgi:HTH-type transcriptional regulator/antitoxin HigA
MKPKVIRSNDEYEAALSRIRALMDADPATVDEDELDLWATLVDLYEREHFRIDLPDPVAAIRFRMEQAGLRQADLVPFIGSRAKVSEVLNRKRGLSLKMIRALHKGLGIPAEVLLGEQYQSISLEDISLDWSRFPVGEMAKRGWFSGFGGTARHARDHAEELMRSLVKECGDIELQPALLRRHIRAGSSPDEYALLGWQFRVLALASREKLTTYKPGSVTLDFARELVRLSYFDQGPLLAKEYLAKIGIPLITERHLSGTHLDGAALTMAGRPIIALTLRYDRLDNFWFTICHELAHIALHLDDSPSDTFIDDLDVETSDEQEGATDAWAREALIDSKHWKHAPVRSSPAKSKVLQFAAELRISPAIIAGRIRNERNNYRILNSLVGHGAVRRLFDSPIDTRQCVTA